MSLERSQPALLDSAIEFLSQELCPPTDEALSTLWRPDPRNRRQCEAYECLADDLYFGGGSGGGKTDLILGLALTRHRHSAIFRRTYKQLRAIEERLMQIVGSNRGFNQTKNILRLPGRVIELGGMEHEKDKQDWQGRPHDFYGYDEGPHFLESQFVFSGLWNRTTVPGQRCRRVVAGNPPTTPEGYWIIKWWAPWLDRKHRDPAKPGELRWFAMLDGKDVEVGESPFHHHGELVYPRSRTFIPALVGDNPYLAKDRGYLSMLQSAPEPLRSQMLYGDHSIGLSDNEWQIVPSAWVIAAQERWKCSAGKPKGGRWDCLGVDPARGGAAKMVIAPRFRNHFGALVKIDGAKVPDGPKAVALVAQMWEKGVGIALDVIGIGSSVLDCLRSQEIREVQPINSAERPEWVRAARDASGKFGFANLRSLMWWRFREALDPENGVDIELPDDTELFADLCAPTYSVTVRGIQVEPKPAIMERLGRSPDCGDAVIYAYHGRAGEHTMKTSHSDLTERISW